MVSSASHGAPNVGIGIFAINTRGNKFKQNAATIFVHHVYVSSSSRPHWIQVIYALEESQLFWSWQIPNTHNWSPCRKQNGADSWISNLNLWTTYNVSRNLLLCVSKEVRTTCDKNLTVSIAFQSAQLSTLAISMLSQRNDTKKNLTRLTLACSWSIPMSIFRVDNPCMKKQLKKVSVTGVSKLGRNFMLYQDFQWYQWWLAYVVQARRYHFWMVLLRFLHINLSLVSIWIVTMQWRTDLITSVSLVCTYKTSLLYKPCDVILGCILGLRYTIDIPFSMTWSLWMCGLTMQGKLSCYFS